MGSGGSKAPTQTTTANLSPEQQGLLSTGMPFAQQYAQQGGVNLPTEAPVAGFTDPQKQGQQMALNTAGSGGALSTTAGNAAGASNTALTGQYIDPNNPTLLAAENAANLPARQNLQLNTLPSIGRQAVASGGTGGSREGVAQGVATGLEAQGEQATNAGMQLAARNQGIQAQLQALGLVPQTQAAELAPASTTSGVGDVQQQLQQALKSYGFGRDVFQQEQPLSIAQALMGLSSGIPGGSTTTVGSLANKPSAMQGALGGGMAGASAGSAFGPWGALIGGAGGAGLGYMSNR